MNNHNFISLLLICLSVLGSSCLHSVRHDTALIEASFKDVAGVVFCELRPGPDDETVYYGSLSEIITDPLLILEWTRALADASPADRRDLMFCGHLAHLLFLDRKQKPIANVSIVNWECRGSVTPIPRYRNKESGFFEGGVFWAWRKNKSRGSYWQSEAFVRSVYNYMQLNRSDEIQRLRDYYVEMNGSDLERMLFEGDD